MLLFNAAGSCHKHSTLVSSARRAVRFLFQRLWPISGILQLLSRLPKPSNPFRGPRSPFSKSVSSSLSLSVLRFPLFQSLSSRFLFAPLMVRTPLSQLLLPLWMRSALLEYPKPPASGVPVCSVPFEPSAPPSFTVQCLSSGLLLCLNFSNSASSGLLLVRKCSNPIPSSL